MVAPEREKPRNGRQFPARADPNGMRGWISEWRGIFFLAHAGINNQHAHRRQRAGNQRQIGTNPRFPRAAAAHENFLMRIFSPL
jgi:hypothetical protein